MHYLVKVNKIYKRIKRSINKMNISSFFLITKNNQGRSFNSSTYSPPSQQTNNFTRAEFNNSDTMSPTNINEENRIRAQITSFQDHIPSIINTDNLSNGSENNDMDNSKFNDTEYEYHTPKKNAQSKNLLMERLLYAPYKKTVRKVPQYIYNDEY